MVLMARHTHTDSKNITLISGLGQFLLEFYVWRASYIIKHQPKGGGFNIMSNSMLAIYPNKNYDDSNFSAHP